MNPWDSDPIVGPAESSKNPWDDDPIVSEGAAAPAPSLALDPVTERPRPKVEILPTP